jgi:hypothetical protein
MGFSSFLTKIMDVIKLIDHWMFVRTDGQSLFLYPPFFLENAGDKKGFLTNNLTTHVSLARERQRYFRPGK